MLLVADTNILISFFNERSTAREFATSSSLALCSPRFALQEINKYKQDILESFSLSDAQFSFILKLMNSVVQFVETEQYKHFLSRAIRVCPDTNDIDFFALALKFDCPVWSNDKKLTKQSKIRIVSTGDLLGLLK